jgi:NADH:ubiquinone oxidoreductase subunit K
MISAMSTSYFKLSKRLRTRLQQELQPGETVVWAGSPDWRASWGNLLFTGVFALGWTTITGFFAIMIAAAAFGFIPWKMNGGPATRVWAFLFLAFLTPFVAIGVALLLHLYRELRSGSHRVHAVTDKRILTVEIGSKKPIDDHPRSAINFVRGAERADGSGTLSIACGTARDIDGSPRAEILIWTGIPDVAFVQTTLDKRSATAVSASQRAPEQSVVPTVFASLPPPLARAAERETRGERIEWVGRPDAKSASRWGMLAWIFALPWLYFTIRWEVTSLGLLMREVASAKTNTPVVWLAVMALWGLPFVGVGLSMLAAPLWIWRKANAMVHIVTDSRIVSIRRQRGEIAVSSVEPSRIVSVTRTDYASGRGTIRIVLGKTTDSDGDETDLAETFWLVENAARAEQLIEALRAHDDRKAA